MRRRRLFLPAIIAAVTISTFIHFYNPLASQNMDTLLSKELSCMPRMRHFSNDGQMLSISKLQIDKKYECEWKDTQDEMRKTGASDEEINGVLKTAHRHFSYTSSDDCYTYGVPVKARRIWIKFKPVWIIDFRWGVGSENPKWGLTEPPSHVRALAIEGRKPYKKLGMQTCS